MVKASSGYAPKHSTGASQQAEHLRCLQPRVCRPWPPRKRRSSRVPVVHFWPGFCDGLPDSDVSLLKTGSKVCRLSGGRLQHMAKLPTRVGQACLGAAASAADLTRSASSGIRCESVGRW